MGRTHGFGTLPYRAISAVLLAGIAGFAATVAVGWLEVRRPGRIPEAPAAKGEAVPGPPAGTPPGPYVQRLKAAEALAGPNVMSVYRFAGGVPKCWAEIDSEGHKRILEPVIDLFP